MEAETKRLTDAWMRKAKSDLATAQLLIRGVETHLDTGVYHCQQAAEKALKAWLTANQEVFPKTHDLVAILGRVQQFDPAFPGFEKQATLLTPMAVEFRYPGDVFEPALQDAHEALQCAHEIYLFVEARLASADCQDRDVIEP